jgi:SAM-dependent methyltransferase
MRFPRVLFDTRKTTDGGKSVFDNDFLWLLNRKPAARSFGLGRSSAGPTPDDGDLVVRTIAAYRKAHAEYRKSSSGWDLELWQIKRDIHETLLTGSVDQVVASLRHPASTTLFWGFDTIAEAPLNSVEPHELVLRRVDAKTDWTVLYAVWVMDAVRSLAEAVGAVRAAYPEIDRELEQVPESLMSVDPILDAIEARLNFQIDFPNPFPGELGLPSRRGIVSFRAVQALYQAWRIASLARGRPGFRVLEIGAGLGRTAYYAARMGIRDYTIIDIPLTNAAQAYFLGRTLSGDGIRLHGEDPSSGCVRIVPTHMMGDLQGWFDLVVSVDSMTELAAEVARGYYDFAKRQAGMLLSVNHEINGFTVHSLYASDADAVALRHPYWMRRGYVEEIVTWPKARTV